MGKSLCQALVQSWCCNFRFAKDVRLKYHFLLCLHNEMTMELVISYKLLGWNLMVCLWDSVYVSLLCGALWLNGSYSPPLSICQEEVVFLCIKWQEARRNIFTAEPLWTLMNVPWPAITGNTKECLHKYSPLPTPWMLLPYGLPPFYYSYVFDNKHLPLLYQVTLGFLC